MREHQIVVNLKAQQFEQLQKLARERGYKSVTAYVKQKVLELALGLEPEQSTEPAMTPSGGAVVDLKRIHGELKSFLDELSVPTKLSGVASPAAPQRTALEIAPPDEDFAWSPTIATPGNVSTGRVSFDLGQSAAYESPAVIPQASSLSQSSSASQDSGEALPQVLPSSNLGGFGFGLGMSSYGSNSARFQTPFSSGDRLSGYRDIMDDMEELADRAFAISPRLGALDENVDDQPEENSRGGGRKRSIEVEEEPAQTSQESWDFSSIDKEEEEAALAATGVPTGVSAEVSAEPASFVAPIVPANLPGVEELAELEHQEKLEQERELQAQRERDQQVELAKQQSLLAAAERAEQMALKEAADEPAVRRRSATAPMLPPPDEIDDGPRAPTYVPPPAPLPPRVSQTNIPAMASPPEMAASSVSSADKLEEFGAGNPVDVEDDLLSDLLDSDLAAAHVAHSHRGESEPNPFAVSLSFELEAAAMEEQTPIGQVAMEEEALLEEAEADQDVSSSISTTDSSVDGVTTTDKVPNSKTTSDSEDQSVNAPTFSGTPPPKRRRT